MSKMRQHIEKGFKVGLSLAFVYAIVAAVIFAVTGVSEKIASVYILLYFVVGGMLGGVFAGALLPISDNKPGAFLVGTVGFLPFGLLLGLLLSITEQEPLFLGVIVGVGSALMLGGPLGIFYLHPGSGSS